MSGPGELAHRDPRLDGLRGLAILLVMLFHTIQYGLVTRPVDRVLTALPALGWSGVDLFFVLSGFLITNILLTTRRSPDYARTFYARRTLRIFPLYYATLAFLLVVAPRWQALAGLDLAWSGGRETDGVWYWLYLSNIGAALSGGWDHRSLAIAWSLAIEEQFYLVWPWVVRRLPERTLLLVCGGVAAVALLLRIALVEAGASDLTPYVLTPCRLDTLATGAAIALVARTPGGLAPFATSARRALIAASALFLSIALMLRMELAKLPPSPVTLGLNLEPWMQTIGYSALCVMWGALLVVLLTSPVESRLSKAFSLRPLQHLGRYSYACYLFHIPISIAIGRWVARGEFLRHFAIAQILYWVAVIGATYVAARISWALLEAPLLSLKRYFPYRDA